MMDILMDAFFFAARYTLVCAAIIAGVLATISGITVIGWGSFRIAIALLDQFEIRRK